MMCAWKELIAILPPYLRPEVDRLGRETLQELRLRVNSPPELVLATGRNYLSGMLKQEDLDFVIQTASRYSPWACETLRYGYLTGPGGHRIGVCGEVISRQGEVEGIRKAHSLCIRVARDFPGISRNLGELSGNILILGPPGSGKTTLLRDLIRNLSQRIHIGVVDERRELFPEGFSVGTAVDVLSGCCKSVGMELLLKTMGPEAIAVDEITSETDCCGLLRAANCGVRLLATAHAGNLKDFESRGIYEPLRRKQLFDHIVLLRRNQTFTVERMTICT